MLTFSNEKKKVVHKTNGRDYREDIHGINVPTQADLSGTSQQPPMGTRRVNITNGTIKGGNLMTWENQNKKVKLEHVFNL